MFVSAKPTAHKNWTSPPVQPIFLGEKGNVLTVEFYFINTGLGHAFSILFVCHPSLWRLWPKIGVFQLIVLIFLLMFLISRPSNLCTGFSIFNFQPIKKKWWLDSFSPCFHWFDRLLTLLLAHCFEPKLKRRFLIHRAWSTVQRTASIFKSNEGK